MLSAFGRLTLAIPCVLAGRQNGTPLTPCPFVAVVDRRPLCDTQRPRWWPGLRCWIKRRQRFERSMQTRIVVYNMSDF